MATRVLIVDDEQSIRQMVVMALSAQGYEVLEADNGRAAQTIVVDNRPDLILLDWMMPGISGIDLVRRFKRDETTADIPVIMLTARGEEEYRVQGLEAGVDDYLPKPFSVRELGARIKAVLRRTSPSKTERLLLIGRLVLDPVSKRVALRSNEQANVSSLDGLQEITLGPTEYRLLEFFMSQPDRAFSRSHLLDRIWGGNVYIEDRTVDVHIRRLRKALTPFDQDQLVQTVRGIGYRFSNLAVTVE